nr:MAG TPA: hypothetical protein [Caudoviricetes sp.]
MYQGVCINFSKAKKIRYIKSSVNALDAPCTS